MIDCRTLETVRTALESELQAQALSVNYVDPPPYDIYVAASALQKSIRRGDLQTAIESSRRLFTDDEPRFWRRLTTIAFEDIGLGNTKIVSQLVAVAANKRWRLEHGGSWHVAHYLLTRLCASPKDRTTDDLLVVVDLLPSLTMHRRTLGSASSPALARTLEEAMTIEEQATAIWYLMGTRRHRSNTLVQREGDPSAVWETFANMFRDETLIEVSRFGAIRGAGLLAAFLPLIERWACPQATVEVREPLPQSPRIAGGPSYALDWHTRPGRIAIRWFNQRCKEWGRFLAQHVSRDKWDIATGDTIFRVEGGLVNRRLSWPCGDRIRAIAHTIVPGLPPSLARDARHILEANLDLLDSVRREVSEQNLPPITPTYRSQK